MIMQNNKVLAGNTKNTNTLQLGEPVAVTFPFTATADGILLFFSSADAPFGRSFTRTRNGVDKVFYFSGNLGDSQDLVTKKGDVWKRNDNDDWMKAEFYPFVPTTGETVEQSYDPTSSLPISGVGVAEAFAVESITPVTSFGSNVVAINDTDGPKVIKYKNGLKQLVGAVTVTAELDNGSTILTVPTELTRTRSGIQEWVAMCGVRGILRVCLMPSSRVFHWGNSKVPSDIYSFNFWYL